MIVLFIHQNFPAQYVHIALALAAQPEHRVFFITQSVDNSLPRVIKLVYKPDHPRENDVHAYTTAFDAAVRTGLAVAQVCRKLRDGGIHPQLIIGHAGWGETLFVKDVFPAVPLLANFEFFYHAEGADVGFDAEFSPPYEDDAMRLKVRNALNRLSFAASDWGHTATAWQRSLFPVTLQAQITVLHEGVDTDRVRPDEGAWLDLARENIRLSRQDEVITYVARTLEPYRGFHIFMRALPSILRRRPRAQVLIAGADGISYGAPAPGGVHYRDLLRQEIGSQVDMERVHFLGHVPHDLYINLLQISSVHVYLSYPFVLSWSCIEAMAAGCLLVGSATAPVLEVLQHGENGYAVDFFDVDALADQVVEALCDTQRSDVLRQAAREQAVREFDLQHCILPQWFGLIGDLLEGRRPPESPPTAGLATQIQLR